jgi:iron complex transport system ATP-binding protein
MALVVSHICFSYQKNVSVLSDVSLAAKRGELISIIGKNGCGKSTFIKCINRILIAHEGSITLDGIDLFALHPKERARYMSYVPQVSHIDTGGTVLDIALLGRKPYLNWILSDTDIDIALKVLKSINMDEFATHLFSNLSGGQKQKVLLARAIIQDPHVLLLDEPTNFLDIQNQIEIMDIMQRTVKTEHKIAFMVVHDLNLAFHYSDKVLLLEQGRSFAFDTPEKVLTAKNIKNIFGVSVKINKAEKSLSYIYR